MNGKCNEKYCVSDFEERSCYYHRIVWDLCLWTMSTIGTLPFFGISWRIAIVNHTGYVIIHEYMHSHFTFIQFVKSIRSEVRFLVFWYLIWSFCFSIFIFSLIFHSVIAFYIYLICWKTNHVLNTIKLKAIVNGVLWLNVGCHIE